MCNCGRCSIHGLSFVIGLRAHHELLTRIANMNAIDPKALKILLNAYWQGGRWVEDLKPRITKEEFEYAKRMGLMFDPIPAAHDGIVDAALKARDTVAFGSVVAAFVASLTSGKRQQRSALGSYAVLARMPQHSFHERDCCPVCGTYNFPEKQIDLNLCNVERFKWGGVRHETLRYAALDLQCFAAEEVSDPTTEDVAILRKLLQVIGGVESNCQPIELAKQLRPVFKSNQSERITVVEILSYCGILEHPDHRGFLERFPMFADRAIPASAPMALADSYPLVWWHGACGVNESAVQQVFAEYL